MIESLDRVVTAVKARTGHRVFLRFDDGVEGEVDLSRVILRGFTGIMAPLADPGYVAKVELDVEGGTVRWPNGADLDPVVLYCAVRGIPVPSPQEMLAAGRASSGTVAAQGPGRQRRRTKATPRKRTRRATRR